MLLSVFILNKKCIQIPRKRRRERQEELRKTEVVADSDNE